MLLHPLVMVAYKTVQCIHSLSYSSTVWEYISWEKKEKKSPSPKEVKDLVLMT